ncbi:MAG: PucR family transcriptional regulator, partial [Dermatophilaceae bacterium]
VVVRLVARGGSVQATAAEPGRVEELGRAGEPGRADALPAYGDPRGQFLVDITDRDALSSALDADKAR